MTITLFCLISLISLVTMTIVLMFVPYEYDIENTRRENFDD